MLGARMIPRVVDLQNTVYCAILKALARRRKSHEQVIVSLQLQLIAAFI